MNPVFTPPGLPKPPIALGVLSQILPETTLVGDAEFAVSDLVHPKFLSRADEMALIIEPAALEILKTGRVKAAIIAKEIVDEVPIPEGVLAGYLVAARPRHALAYLLNIFNKPPHLPPAGVHPTAFIGEGAQVHPEAHIGPYCVIGDNAKIGAGSMLLSQVTVAAEAVVGDEVLFYPGVRIGERVVIGNQVVIHSNACIGTDGFSFVTPQKGSVEAAKEGKMNQAEAKNTDLIRIHSIGTVVIEDNVEIGSCTCIDRSTLGATIIKKGTKLDNLVQIGHNNVIGENCLIVAQAGVAGSCQIGDRVVLAGQAGLADHLKIADDAIVTAKSGVMRDIGPGEVVAGYPAFPARESMKNVMMIGRLSDMHKDMKDLKKRLAALESELSDSKNTLVNSAQ